MAPRRSSPALLKRLSNVNRSSVSSGKPTRRPSNGCQLSGTVGGGIIVAAVVVEVTVKGEAVFPFGVTDAGERTQVASEGAPVQVSATEALKPLMGVT